MNDATDASFALDRIVTAYRKSGDVGVLLSALDEIARAFPTAELVAALAPYMELHEVAGPVFEAIVEREPDNARALVALANAYWLTGRGPEVVAGLATRALAADPANRAAWHLSALAQASPRERTERWSEVVARFPEDDLARANLADNAASLAGSENDSVALKLAISSYEVLLARATRTEQRAALEQAIAALKGWTG